MHFIFRKGSTIVEFEVITDNKEEAKQDIVSSIISLSKGEGNILYANELITPSSVSVIDATGEERGLHWKSKYLKFMICTCLC